MNVISTKYLRIVFWRAAGCFKSACAILDKMEDPNKGLTLKGTGKPLFIRALEGSKYVPQKGDFIINWGNGGYATFPELKNSQATLFQNPDNVAIATNKLKTFQKFAEHKVRTVYFTEDKKDAEQWLKNNHIVIARKVLSGCCGEGIVVVNPGEKLPDAPLYTMYRKKTHEYRVHVFNGEVIDVVQKRLKNGNKSNGIIRNVDDGWVFCHEDIKEPSDLRELAIKAVGACGLKFGAVDIIWNKHYNRCYVLEVNTAPGLEKEKTILAYTNAIIKEIK